MAPRHVIVIGPPGSGKGTQARRLAERLDVPHLSVGALLRSEIDAATPLGRRVADRVAAGELVPDDDIDAVLRDSLARADRGWVLDGAPRTLQQAEQLSDLLDRPAASGGAPIVVALDVPDHLTRARLLARADSEDRSDDTPEVIEHRLATWAADGPPLLAHYRDLGRLVTVDGTGDVDEVTAALFDALDLPSNG